MTLQTTKTKMLLDGRWNLEELSETTKGYTQLYGFAFSLLDDLPSDPRIQIDYLYAKLPWRGGYSTVNFFNQLFHKVPPKLRPEVERIQYASPGFIELSELLIVAVTVAGIVKAVCSTINNAHDTYRRIQKGSYTHKLSQINLAHQELELTKEQGQFCEESAKKLVNVLGLSETQEQLLDKRVRGNAGVKLKILLSVFRRAEPLARKQSEGKLEVTAEESKDGNS